jgi:hypothetical protein
LQHLGGAGPRTGIARYSRFDTETCSDAHFEPTLLEKSAISFQVTVAGVS